MISENRTWHDEGRRLGRRDVMQFFGVVLCLLAVCYAAIGAIGWWWQS